MTKNTNMERQGGGSITSYVIGFVFSLVFTLTAYYLVETHMISRHTAFSHEFLLIAILTLAFAQFTVQLFLFLHLGYESGPRWRLIIFLVTFSLLLVIVLGSVWIMNHLNYNMMQMTPDQVDIYMINHI